MNDNEHELYEIVNSKIHSLFENAYIQKLETVYEKSK